MITPSIRARSSLLTEHLPLPTHSEGLRSRLAPPLQVASGIVSPSFAAARGRLRPPGRMRTPSASGAFCRLQDWNGGNPTFGQRHPRAGAALAIACSGVTHPIRRDSCVPLLLETMRAKRHDRFPDLPPSGLRSQETLRASGIVTDRGCRLRTRRADPARGAKVRRGALAASHADPLHWVRLRASRASGV